MIYLSRSALALLPLLSAVAHARPQSTDQCPNNGICPNPDNSNTHSSCGIPTIDFPGLDLDALRAKDTVKAGTVEIINCGPFADTVKQWLAKTQQIAQAAAVEASLGVRSPYGFQAIFKDQSQVDKVSGVYHRIADMVTPYSGCLADKSPAIMCVVGSVPQTLNDVCTLGGVNAFVTTDVPWVVMICPRVASFPSLDSVKCPGRANNQATPNDDALLRAPESILVEEFAHMYLGLDENHVEKYGIQDQIDMSAADSLLNGPSYASYSTCKSIVYLESASPGIREVC